MKRLFHLIGILVLIASPCAAGEITQKNGQGTLAVRYGAHAPKITLADLITVTLTVDGRKGLRVKAPDQFPPDFPWLLVEMSKPQRTELTPERESWRLLYRLAPRAPGQRVVLRFPDVQVRESQDPTDEQTIKWDPLEFEVTTTIANPDRAGLRDITAIETVPTDPPLEPFAWRWLALALILLVSLIIVFGLRGFLRRRSLRTAAQLALYEWQRLIALKLPEQGRGERFITLLTLIVRQYLERRFAIPARRQTTPEFLNALSQHTLLTTEEKQFLTAFLQQAEAVKFAQSAISIEECQRWADAARLFLDRRQAA